MTRRILVAPMVIGIVIAGLLQTAQARAEGFRVVDDGTRFV